MTNKESRYKELIQQFENENPQFQILNKLGEGQFGVVFELNDGNAIKFTLDKRELRVCNAIIGNVNRHICNIYKMGELAHIVEGRHYKWVIEERLYENNWQSRFNQAVSDFRHTWFCLFSPSISDGLNEDTLWEIYNRKDNKAVHRARELLEKYILNINIDEDRFYKLTEKEIEARLSDSLMFFDFILEAYHELLSICPFGRIDLNGGNFLFDKNGRLKTFDILTIDE